MVTDFQKFLNVIKKLIIINLIYIKSSSYSSYCSSSSSSSSSGCGYCSCCNIDKRLKVEDIEDSISNNNGYG